MPKPSHEERWRGGSSEGDKWSIEIEVDRFSTEDPFVCSIWVETEPGTDDPDDRPVQALAMPSAEQAREMAACLLRVADGVDFNNDRDKRAAWLKPPGHPAP
jgi:hypothetical protein